MNYIGILFLCSIVNFSVFAQNPFKSIDTRKSESAKTISFLASPDDEQRILVGGDGFIGFWYLETSTPPTYLKKWKGLVEDIVCNEERILAGGTDVFLWRNPTDKDPTKFTNIPPNVRSVAFDPLGEKIGIGGSNDAGFPSANYISIISASNEEAKETELGNYKRKNVGAVGVSDVAFSSDNKYLSIANHHETFIYDITSVKNVKDIKKIEPYRTFNNNSNENENEKEKNAEYTPEAKICFNKTNRYLFSAWGKTLSVFEIETDKKIISINDKHTDDITAMIMSSDGKYIITCGLDNKILIWDCESINNLNVVKNFSTNAKNKTFFIDISLSPSGKKLASLDNVGKILFWDVSDLKIQKKGDFTEAQKKEFADIATKHIKNYLSNFSNISDASLYEATTKRILENCISEDYADKEILYNDLNLKEDDKSFLTPIQYLANAHTNYPEGLEITFKEITSKSPEIGEQGYTEDKKNYYVKIKAKIRIEGTYDNKNTKEDIKRDLVEIYQIQFPIKDKEINKDKVRIVRIEKSN